MLKFCKCSEYETYMDKEIPWLGKLPVDWGYVQLRNIADRFSNGTTADQIEYEETVFPVSRIETISTGQIDYSRVGFLKNGNRLGGFRLLENDFLISHINSYEKIGNSAHFDGGRILWHGMNLLRLTPKEKVNPIFLKHILKSEVFVGAMKRCCKPAINQVSVPSSSIKAIKVPLPGRFEQTLIANFLDKKTAQIDEAIAIKEQQIALLKERKQIIIQKAVTQGLDPDVPMKDSGVDWIGEIPAHWEAKRLKYITKIVKRIIGFEGPDVLSITQKGIKVKDIKSGEGQLAMDYSKYQIVNVGDFAMNHMDLLTGYVDISKFNGVVSPDYRVFQRTHEGLNDEFLLAIFQLGYQQKIFYRYGQGVSLLGRWRFPAENFNNFFVPIPPKEEQLAIVQFVATEWGKIEKGSVHLVSQIEKLKEYKTTLINSAVTGKIKVTPDMIQS